MAKSARKTPKKDPEKAPKKTLKKKVGKAAKKSSKPLSKKAVKKFLIIYHAPPEAMAQTSHPTPEQLAAGMALWKAWAERVGNRMADLGAPLINGKSLNQQGISSKSSREVAGYSLLEAADWEELMTMLDGHPHLSGWSPEATIEIHETMMMPGL